MKKLIKRFRNWYKQLFCEHELDIYNMFIDYQDRCIVGKCYKCGKDIYEDF